MLLAEVLDRVAATTPALRVHDIVSTHADPASNNPANAETTTNERHLKIGPSTPKPQQKSLWISHGIMMMFAFGVCIPIGIGGSMLRNIIPGDALWFSVHTIFNFTALTLVLAAFGIAVYQIQISRAGTHFDFYIDNHRTIGLAVTVGICMNVLGGYCRPKVTIRQATSEDVNVTTEESVGPDGEIVQTAKVKTGPVKSQTRIIWEWLHRCLGLAIVGLAWYNVHLGINYYYKLYGEQIFPHVQLIFWCVGGALLGIALLGGVTRIFL